jgi:hypothetical protein
MAFIALSTAALHRLGRWFPLEMLLDSGGPLEPTFAAVLRLIGLGVGYWLAASTILYLIGRAGKLPTAVRAVGWATIAPVRRLIDGIVAGALVVTVGLPAHAGTMTEPGYVPIPAGDQMSADPAMAENPIIPGTGDWPLTPETEPSEGRRRAGQRPLPPIANPGMATPGTADPGSTVLPAPASFEATEIVVRPGDHMWALAEQRLSAVRGRVVSDSEIAPYWLQVVAINLSSIRSGDPDLIFPGEVLALPAIDP